MNPPQPGPPRTWAMSHPGSLAIIVLACLVVLCAGVHLAAPVLIPMIIACYLAIVSVPAVVTLRARRVPVPLATLLALIVVTGVLAGLVGLVVRATAELATRWPIYQSLLLKEAQELSGWLARQGLEPSLSEFVAPTTVGALVAGLVSDVASLLWSLTLAVIIAAFLLLRFVPIVGTSAHVVSEPLLRAVREVNRYVIIKTATSAATGLLVGTLTWLLDADLPLLYGLLAFVLNYIPNLGSVIAAVPPVVLALLQQGFGEAVVMASGYLAINVTIGNFIEPRIMGRALGLSPLAVLLSVIFWGWLLGVTGALFSALLTLLVKLLLLATEDLRPLGRALGPRRLPGEEPALADASLIDEALPQTVPPRGAAGS